MQNHRPVKLILNTTNMDNVVVNMSKYEFEHSTKLL